MLLGLLHPDLGKLFWNDPYGTKRGGCWYRLAGTPDKDRRCCGIRELTAEMKDMGGDFCSSHAFVREQSEQTDNQAYSTGKWVTHFSTMVPLFINTAVGVRLIKDSKVRRFIDALGKSILQYDWDVDPTPVVSGTMPSRFGTFDLIRILLSDGIHFWHSGQF
ncbi:MAG: hypothetical protein GY866_41745, partial [Proteobacteria bacterium]|nr:hypothetical protein [Pseudomonadota bacterium]